MISARRLIEASGNFWRDLTPLLPNYVKHVNMGGYDRFDAPIRSGTEKARHFLINELAFACFARGFGPTTPAADACYQALQAKWSRRLPNNPWIDVPIAEEERFELLELIRRLRSYRRDLGLSQAQYETVVPAVGRLESIEIDLLTDKSICEVKSGERPFRSIDYRQVILALIAISKIQKRDRLVLINPREGIVWREQTDAFIEAVSLRTFPEFIDDAFYELSDVGISA